MPAKPLNWRGKCVAGAPLRLRHCSHLYRRDMDHCADPHSHGNDARPRFEPRKHHDLALTAPHSHASSQDAGRLVPPRPLQPRCEHGYSKPIQT